MTTTNNKSLNLYPIDYPFETLVDRIKNNKLILDPEFQRIYKWDNERASKFIESCLMRLPLPACYFAETIDNKHEVIDGVQRITTIYKFINNEFALQGLTIFEELEGKFFKDLGYYRSELETTTIRCIVLRKDNDKDIIKEIFARLNQGAVILTHQEIRHAVYPGNFDKLLTELAKIPIIEKFGTGDKDGRQAEEMVLRFFAMNTDLQNYEGKLSKYLDKYMKDKKDILHDEVSELRNLYINTLKKCELVFGSDVFADTNKDKQRQSLIYYDLLMWSFSKEGIVFLRNNKEQIQDKFQKMCASDEFKKKVLGGLQQKPSILSRRKLWNSYLNQLRGEHE